MSSARVPWWIWLVAASFIACFIVGFLYLPFKLPETPGINVDFATLRVSTVRRGSPGDLAGFKPGDKLIRADGHELRNTLDLGSVLLNTTFDHPLAIDVVRGNQELHLQFTLKLTTAQGWSAREYAGWWVEVAVSLIQLLVGLLVLFKRPRDITGIAAGIFLCSLGTGNPLFLQWPGAAVVWRNLPLAVQWLVFPAVTLNLSGLPIAPILLFSLSFPKPVLHRPWAWTVLAVLAGPLLAGSIAIDYKLLFSASGALAVFPTWFLIIVGLAGPSTFLASLVMLAVNYLTLREANEKRRIRLVVFGLLLFLADVFVGIVCSFSLRTQWIGQLAFSSLVFGIVQIPFTICVAYAVLKQRLFQVRLIVRQSLQYAVARGALLIPIPVVAGIIVFDLIAHRDKPFGVLLSAHGWAYALMVVVGVVAHAKQSQWMELLDRRFYREHYNAQQLLRQTVDEIRTASNLPEVAPKTVARIEQALHPEFVAIMMREPAETLYRCIASAPGEIQPPGLSADSKLMAVFRLFAKPLQISQAESGWLQMQLPLEDTNFLRDAHIDLMVPIAMASEGREAIMILGPKKSEEPYSNEDQELLSATGSALALVLERPFTSASGGFEECPRCGLCYESGVGSCTSEGAQLTRMPFRRMLASRYRLDRRLGRGGMGTVYKSTDTWLERAVAVKLIREDLISNVEAAERFRREAKAAASFAHPNLVTIHDFGADSETRVFLVMELLEGATLRQHLERRAKFAIPHFLQILGGVCAGLEAAHEHGLIHRDLKPENIFLAQSRGGEVTKILDFGLAKFLLPRSDAAAVTIDTVSGVLLGTPQYMSPDQLNGEAVSPAWDLWALAVITYEMLTGTHPFPATSVGQMQYAIVRGRFTPLSASLPDAPAEWQQFFNRALNPNTSERPQSAKEFVSALHTAFGVAGKGTAE